MVDMSNPFSPEMTRGVAEVGRQLALALGLHLEKGTPPGVGWRTSQWKVFEPGAGLVFRFTIECVPPETCLVRDGGELLFEVLE